MTNVIYYFTGTGNSLAVARQMAELLGESHVIPVTRAMEEAIPPAESIGILFPVYSHRPPMLVERFMKKLKAARPTAYIYAIATSGDGPGLVLKAPQKILGADLDYAATLQMPFNFLPFGTPVEGAAQQKMLGAAQAKVAAMATDIKKRVASIEPIANRFAAYIHPGILYAAIYPLIPQLDRSFYATDACKGCGRCASICPAKNLTVEKKRPQWSHNCEQCWACLHWCPQQAIQNRLASPKKKRYHHPAVTLSDMRSQQA